MLGVDAVDEGDVTLVIASCQLGVAGPVVPRLVDIMGERPELVVF